MGLAADAADVPAALADTGRFLFVVDRAGVVRKSCDVLDEHEARALDEDLKALARE